MGQLMARAVMKSTIEVIFPNLAGVLDPSTTALQLAGSSLNTAGVGLGTAAMQLSAAAASMGVSTGVAASMFGGMIPGQVGSGGSFGNAGGTDMTMGSYAHSGGYVGSMPQTPMPTSLFENAPRFHNGLKLQSDEFPTILQQGEEVISKRDRQSGKAPTVNINVSSIDASGTYQFLNKNKRTIASMLQTTLSKNNPLRRGEVKWK